MKQKMIQIFFNIYSAKDTVIIGKMHVPSSEQCPGAQPVL